MTWMAWTLPTALFFIAIGTALVSLTIWELISPTVKRRGFLPIATTRGDRFFISLLGAGFIHLLLLGLVGAYAWWMAVVALIWLCVVMRWG